MTQVIFLKRTLICVLFLFSACSKNPCQKWHKLDFESCGFLSERKTFPSECSYAGLSLEYTLYPDQNRFFINIEGCPITELKPEITFSFKNFDKVVTGDLFGGGQRVALPQEINSYILQALENGETFEVKMLRYHTQINPINF